jgi:hypothetical protein
MRGNDRRLGMFSLEDRIPPESRPCVAREATLLPVTLVTVVRERPLLDCGEMPRLSADEIASMLLARLVKEVENFAAGIRIDDDAKVEEIWSRFVKYLRDGKPSKPSTSRVGNGSKKTASTKRHGSIQ